MLIVQSFTIKLSTALYTSYPLNKYSIFVVCTVYQILAHAMETIDSLARHHSKRATIDGFSFPFDVHDIIACFSDIK